MVVTSSLAERLARADVALWTDWHRALLELPDNPHGVTIKRFGDATGLMVYAIPDPYFNRVLGLSESSVSCVPDIVRYYSERMVPCRFDVDPFAAGTRTLTALADAGFRPAEFQTNLYGGPHMRRGALPAGVRVREVRFDELGFFATLYERAYNHARNVPTAIRQFRVESIKARFRQSRWRFYMAIVDGMPAGGAILHVRDGVGTLTGGATMYTLRGRGCQRALLLHRLEEAADLGCDLVVSRCAVGSVSQRNMERCGMSTAFTKVIWRSSVSLTETRRLPTDPRAPLPRLARVS